MLGDELRRLRRAAGIEIAQLAMVLGVSRPTISRWETGTRRPDIQTVARFLDVVRATPDERLALLAKLSADLEAAGALSLAS